MYSQDAYEDASTWGNYSDEVIFDIRTFDPEAHGFLDAHVVLWTHEPTLKVIRFANANREREKLLMVVESKMFEAVEYLDLDRKMELYDDSVGDPPDDELMAELVSSGHLKRIRFLNLDNCYNVGDKTLMAIASGGMPALERLSLDRTSVGDAGLAALADSTQTPKLVHVQGVLIEAMTEAGVNNLVEKRPGMMVSLTQ